MTCIHPEAEQMIWKLSRQLGQVGGKKTYGYLPKPMKSWWMRSSTKWRGCPPWIRATRHGGSCNVRWRITTPKIKENTSAAVSAKGVPPDQERGHP